MNSQQLLDHIITPTLKYMGGNYDSLDARMLLLSTAAIESNCGYYIKQVGGPALGIWQMEPATHCDIHLECDALNDELFMSSVMELSVEAVRGDDDLIVSPMYACAMARLKYAMDPKRLPSYNDKHKIYDYYKRIYNTELGASTREKFLTAWDRNGLDKVKLS
jgi:hypothetical protein